MTDAQGDPPTSSCLNYEPTGSIEWPATKYGSGSDFRRIVAGNLEGNADIDGASAVVLAENSIVLMPGFQYQTALLAIGWDSAAVVEDIAILPDGVASGRDGLLVSDDDGLHLLTVEGDA